MHEYNPLDLSWYVQLSITAIAVIFGLLYIVKNTASKYFVVDGDDDARFDSHSQSSSSSSPSSPSDAVVSPSSSSSMPGIVATSDCCAVCGSLTTKHCARCKLVRYCSEKCQRSHWFSGHKQKCEELQLSCKSSLQGRRNCSAVTLVPNTAISIQSKKILFPYEEFVDLFNWKIPGFPPCGLLNCGNSCFANVVLQCLAYTRPLAAYLLEKGHRRGCRRNDWCFLCELQTHVERASQSNHAFSPINILSRLPNIGGNLGYGKQEDAHEFMRFVIDTMQSVCLDEYGGERAVHPSSQETTLIQHIFGGRLQSQVICTKCSNVSNQFENMMDLIVEIQGDAASLEECLDQFTAKEWLDGDNMYKCDGCNDYVLAWKRLNIHMAPNILTIALKRFQSGRFGKLNKRVTFPETLDLSPYMSEAADGNDKYKLYAVVVHVDMLNASYFGHYICYTKDFSGNWYRIDDCKVTRVELDEVLSQGAYMLLYNRVSPRSSCLNPIEETSKKDEPEASNVSQETTPIKSQTVDHSPEPVNSTGKCISGIHNHPFPANISPENSSNNVTDIAPADSNADSSILADKNTLTSSNNYISTPEPTKPPLTVYDTQNKNNTTVETTIEASVSSLTSSNGDAAKLKPLLAPGFLGKRPRKINNKMEQVNGNLKPCFKVNSSVRTEDESVMVVNGVCKEE